MGKSEKDLIEQAEQLNEEKRYQDIILLLGDDLLKRLNSALLYIHKARAFDNIEKTDDCLINAQKAIDIDPQLSWAYLIKGNAWQGKKDYDKALADYNKAIELSPNYAVAYGNLGQVWYDKKDYDKALEYYDRSIQLDKNYVASYHNRGLVWYDKKDYEKALKDFDKSIQLDPNYKYAYNNRGRIWYNLKEYDKALDDYNKTIALDPGYKYAYNNRGLVWSNREEYDKALDDYNKAIQLDENYSSAFGNRGNVWLIKNEYDKAFDDFNKAIQLDAGFALSYAGRGSVWYNKNDYNKAIEDYNKAIQLDGSYAFAYIGRGNAWYNKKDYDKALEDYSKAIQLDANYTAAYRNRGLVWYNKKDYEKALEDYSKAIDLDGNFRDVYNDRGLVWHDLKEYDKALDDYTKAIQLDENFPFGYYNRARTYGTLGEYKKAIADYQRYIELENNLDDYYTKIALSEIERLKDNLENDWYKEIEQLIMEIKQLLLFDKHFVTHYTSLSAAKAMILENSYFRLSEGAYLNDTSEGRELFDFLSFKTPKSVKHESIAEDFLEKPFIGSFVADNKHNDLALWRMYGKEAQTEARGCSLTINKDLFVNSFKAKLNPDEARKSNVLQNEGKFTFYKVAYRNDDEFSIPDNTKKDAKQFNKLLQSLKVKVEGFTQEQNNKIAPLLNDIAYLFKSAEYQYEHEVRLVVQGVGIDKSFVMDSVPPRVYIKLIEIAPVIEKITLGPKVERADEWAATFNYYIQENYKRKVQIIISHLPFK
ncbi:MAG: tetratricopeptide repeat protein [Mucilaginibacter sp.]